MSVKTCQIENDIDLQHENDINLFCCYKKKLPGLCRDQLKTGKLPEAVLVKFNDESVGIRAKYENGFVSIVLISATFQASKYYGDVSL